MPKVVIGGLKKYPVKISAISAMLDSGGSAGRERKEYQTQVAFGDFRRAALALSESSQKDKDRFAYRYKSGPLAGHVMANMYCSTGAMMTFDGKFEKAIEDLVEDIRDDLKISPQHKVLPSTLDNAHLAAELEDGTMVLGEANIDVPRHEGALKIKKVFLTPKAKAYPKAVQEINKADLIVIGPGDLYSSLAQILLVDGIAAAIRKSRAKKVYICNIMTKHGETNNFSVADFAGEIEKMLGSELDYVLYNTAVPDNETLRNSKRTHRALLAPVAFAKDLPMAKFLGRRLLSRGTIEHDAAKIAKALLVL